MRLEGHPPPQPRSSPSVFKSATVQSAALALWGKYYRGCDLLFCAAEPPAELSEFPCIYPAYPGHPRATVGPALGPLRTLIRVDGRAESAGRPSFWTISPPNRLGAPVSKTVTSYALRNMDAGRRWLRVQAGEPACCSPPSGSSGAVGEWRYRRVGCRSADQCSGRTVGHPDLRIECALW